MNEPITYVGIDAHKAELQVAVLAPDAVEPTIWTVRNEARMVDRLRRCRGVGQAVGSHQLSPVFRTLGGTCAPTVRHRWVFRRKLNADFGGS